MSEPIIPFKAPRAPESEPEAVLKFGDVEVRLTLTYLHHLANCGGWSDRATSETFFNADRVMSEAVHAIEKAMWAEVDQRSR